MGVNGLVFDPSIDWFSKSVLIGFGTGTGAGTYAIRRSFED
jgi:hypothetical protein